MVLQLAAQANEPDPDSANNSSSATAVRDDLVEECCDLALQAQAPARAELDAEISVDGTLANLSSRPATGVKLNIALSGLQYRSASGASCSSSETTVTCTLADLSGGASSAFSLVVAGNAAGDAALSIVVTTESGDPAPTNNSVDLVIAIDRPVDEVVETIMGMIDDPLLEQAAPALIDICTTGTDSLRAQCNVIIEATAAGDSAAASQAAFALLPEEILGQGASVNQLAQVQFDNIATRQAQLRAGAQGFSADGLGFSTGTQSFSVGLLRGLLASDEEPSIGSGGLVSRWGGFINGSISSGHQQAEQSGDLDFDVVGITAGVDYRRSTKWVIGAALGFNRFDSELVDDGTLDIRALTLSAYSAYYPTEQFYLDGRISIGNSRVESQRRVVIANVVDLTADGDTDVWQTSLAASFGYQLAHGSWTFTPNASVQHVRSEFDAFTETGAGDNNASFSSQRTDSTQVSLGVQISKALSLSHGVLLPQLDFSLTRELDDAPVINARLAGAPDVTIRVQSEVVDESFGNVGLGLVYVSANGRQAYLSYRRLFAADGQERGTLSLGARFEF